MSDQLTQEHMERIRRKVEAGLYGSPEEALERALALLDEYDAELEETRRKVQRGVSQIEKGEYSEYDDETLHEFFDDVRARGQERLDSQKPRKSPP